MDSIIYRDARPQDRDEILSFTANTWDHGDYIHFVYDEWLADKSGRFLIIQDGKSGPIVGIDKLTMLAPEEAWFEGLRIRREYRGRGLATQVQRFMISEAQRLGARTIRFITRVGNTPIHLAAYRDGFKQIALVRGLSFRVPATKHIESTALAFTLRPATTNEAPLLYEGWLRGSAYRTAGLVNYAWSFKSTSEKDWIGAAMTGCLLVNADAQPASDPLPAPCVLLLPGAEKEENAWTVSAVSASPGEWAPLMRGMVASAQDSEIALIEGLLPDEHMLSRASQVAGLTLHSDEQCHSVFELLLP